MASLPITTRIEEAGSGPLCRAVLGALPQWFGVEVSVEHYVEAADRVPTVVATAEGRDVGVATIVTHNPFAAEVYVMGVMPEYHRHGVGRAMLRAAEVRLADEGVEFLQVKTRGPSRPDVGYEKTRAFYMAYGFRPLEEFPLLWDAENPALLMVKAVAPGAGDDAR